MYLWTDNAPSPMHRTRNTFALFAAGIVLAIAALGATGQPLLVTLSEQPSALEAGATWQADMKVVRAGRAVTDVRPVVVFTDAAGIRHEFAAKPEAKRGVYHVKIQLPDGGRWSYEVRVGDKVYERGEIRAKPPLAA
jgi:hypothetical protein